MITTVALSLVLSAGMTGGPGCSGSANNTASHNYAMTNASWTADKNIIETAVAAGSFKTLAAALEAAGLLEALQGSGPFTVFAPTDAAFAKLPAGTVENLLKPENKAQLQAVLKYHVVPGKAEAKTVVTKGSWETLNGQQITVVAKGDSVTVDGAKVTATDIIATNGVIHVIDSVILPETKSIPQVAEAAGSFTTLLAAVKAAGLSETLSGAGPFTVFAPTDEAFAALGTTVQDLLKPENKAKLASILTYHVVPGRVFAEQAKGLTEAKTVNGQTVAIESKWGKLKVGGATVVAADIDASNGVIHVIDTVLLPK